MLKTKAIAMVFLKLKVDVVNSRDLLMDLKYLNQDETA